MCFDRECLIFQQVQYGASHKGMVDYYVDHNPEDKPVSAGTILYVKERNSFYIYEKGSFTAKLNYLHDDEEVIASVLGIKYDEELYMDYC